MAVQSTYLTNIPGAKAGMVATLEPSTVISKTVGNSGGVSFGGSTTYTASTNGNTVHATTTGDTTFAGVAVIDQSSTTANGYAQYDTAGLLIKGTVWVTVSVEVDPGETAYVVPATGAYTNVSTSNINTGGTFETESAAAGLVLLRL